MISSLSLKISDVNLFKLILKWMFLCLPFYLWRYGKWSIRHAAHNMSHETVNQYSQFTNETLFIRKYLDISICKNAFYDNSACFRLYSVAMEVNTLCNTQSLAKPLIWNWKSISRFFMQYVKSTSKYEYNIKWTQMRIRDNKLSN